MERRYRDPKRERWIQIVGYSALVGMFLGMFIDAWSKPLIFVREAEASTSTPEVVQTVLIEVVYDTRESKERYIRSVFKEDPETAVKVAWAESWINPKAYNPEKHIGCSGSIGVFQIACVHNRKDPLALEDFEFNVKKAHEIYKQKGWYPWGVCHDGKVNCRI